MIKSQTNPWLHFGRCVDALRSALPMAKFLYEGDLVQDHMHTNTPTPTLFVRHECGRIVGHVRYDKSMVCSRRYVSYYTRLSGGKGGGGEVTIEELLRAFKETYKDSEPIPYPPKPLWLAEKNYRWFTLQMAVSETFWHILDLRLDRHKSDQRVGTIRPGRVSGWDINWSQ